MVPGGRSKGGMSLLQKGLLGGGAAGSAGLAVGMWLAPTAARSGYVTDAEKALSEHALLAKKAAAKALMPSHSALVQQKAGATKSVKGSGLVQELAKAKSLAKSGMAADLASAKKMAQKAQPVKGALTKDAKALKSVAQLRQKQAMKALMPAHSALVKQKVGLTKNLKASGLTQELAKAKSLAKSGMAADLANAKKLAQKAQPVKGALTKDAKALKAVAELRKKQAMKALMPAHSALVQRKAILAKDLAPVRSTIGKDLSGLKKGMSGLKQAAKQSSIVKEERAKKQSLMKLLRIPPS
jgi:hypothetical protein